MLLKATLKDTTSSCVNLLASLSQSFYLWYSGNGRKNFREIVEQELIDLDQEQKKWLIETIYPFDYMRFLRNKYSLWHTSPTTKIWREFPQSHDIRNGIDYSERHPDEVSRQLYMAIKKAIVESK